MTTPKPIQMFPDDHDFNAVLTSPLPGLQRFLPTGQQFRSRHALLYALTFHQLFTSLEDNSVDLILIDPPYIISKKTGFLSVDKGEERFKKNTQFGDWDKAAWDIDLFFSDAYRVLRKGGQVVTFFDWKKLTYLVEGAENHKFKQARFAEWVKTNPVPVNQKVNYLTNCREIILTFTKGGKPTFNSIYDNGIYKGPSIAKHEYHTTQKPTWLIKEIMSKHSNAGDLVVDCFAGSFTTGVAAVELGRRFIGCDPDQTYFEAGVSRIQQAEKEAAE